MSGTRPATVATALASGLLVTLLLAPSSLAAPRTFVANKLGDPSPGACTSKHCTLREAVLAANQNPGRDTLVLRSGKRYELTIPGTNENAGATGDLDLSGPTTVRTSAAGRATIDANGLDRIFDVFARATIDGVRFRGGVTQAAAGEEAGGAIRSVGGRLVIRNSDFAGIEAPALGLGAPNAAIQKPAGPGGILLISSRVRGTNGDAVKNSGAGGVFMRGSRIASSANSGVTQFGDGPISIRDSGISGTGSNGVASFGDGAIALAGVGISDVAGTGVIDFGAGGIRLARSSVRRTTSSGVSDFDAGGVSLSRSLIAKAGAQGVQKFGSGSVSLARSRVIGSGSQGVQSFAGGISVSRSIVGASGLQGVQGFGPGTLAISRSRIRGSGGGNVNHAGSGALEITRSTISGADGPGVAVGSDAAPSKIVASTVFGNRTTSNGGGIRSFGRLTITNSTIAGNRADDNGGGISNSGADAILRLRSVTLARNVANADNAGGGAGGGIASLPGGDVAAANSLIAHNDQVAGDADDCSGSFHSDGGNLRTVGVDCAGFNAPRDAVRANARIGALRNNGGPTLTVALKKGSPAIGRARRNLSPDRDQRGRKRDKHPDSGAYER